MQLHDLEAHLQAAPDSLPEATWTKSLASQIASQAKKTGAVLEASLARLGQDAIDPEDLRKEFAKHAKMDAEQWATVVSYADKQFDLDCRPHRSITSEAHQTVSAPKYPPRALK